MTFNKKGSDWLPSLTDSVLAAFLLIMVALMVYNVAGNIEIHNFNPETDKLDFDMISSRIINSPTCLAWEESYVDLDSHPKTLPHPGIINYDKLVSGANLNSCLGDRNYQISLNDLDGNAWTISRNRGDATGMEDVFFVNIRKREESDMHRGILTIKL